VLKNIFFYSCSSFFKFAFNLTHLSLKKHKNVTDCKQNLNFATKYSGGGASNLKTDNIKKDVGGEMVSRNDFYGLTKRSLKYFYAN
jgi:hypothetical protein